jgi:hypothetical protein
MKKLLMLAAVCGTALVVAVSPASTAKIDDLHGGPVCADITNNSGITDYSNGTLTFVLGTVAPSCRGLTYTVSAYDETTGVLVGTGSATGNKTALEDGSGFVVVTVPIDTSKVTPGSASFCIVATSGDDRVFDRAPDTGCISFPLPPNSGGQSGFN